MVFFIMLYKVVLSFESVDEILKCDQIKSIEQYFPVVLFLFQFLPSRKFQEMIFWHDYSH